MEVTITVMNIAILVGFFISLILIFKMISILVKNYKAAQKRAVNAQKEQEEKERLDALPKLDTTFLLQIPKEMQTGFIEKRPRTFGSRYNRLVIYDEEGNGWVGLFLPEVIQSLKDGEYTQENYRVPFRGCGEVYPGEPITIDGLEINIYPSWMEVDDWTDENWSQWVKIEKKFEEVYKKHPISYHDVFAQIYRQGRRIEEVLAT
ncbi:MAG: hypothetical protein RIQ54_135 [Candidatus Parcubacteria bacterium]|jgi:hypothetical protein